MVSRRCSLSPDLSLAYHHAATNITVVDGVSTSKSATAANTEIAFIFLFGFSYSIGWTPNQGMYPVECLKFENRAKGMGFYNFWVNIASFYNT